jgi:glycosyltransferase involved in cell wall biosynthesis
MTNQRKTILAITSELPWPLNSGGHIRSFHLMRALAREFDFHLVSVAKRSEADSIEVIKQAGIHLHVAKVGDRSKLREATRVIRSALSCEPYVMFQRHNRPELRSELASVLAHLDPDVVYLDHLDPLSFQSMLPDVPIVADLHNVYSKLTERVASERRWPISAYLSRESRLQAEKERLLCRTSAAVMAVSEEERVHFSELGCENSVLVPNGVDCSTFGALDRAVDPNKPVILYLGALSWQPNAKAAEFLARDIMPSVNASNNEAVLQIVGRNPGPEVLDLAKLPNVEVHANVPDIGEYLSQATVMAVPLDSGGGTRLKILEAFAARLPVVSTPIGCEGIDCADREHLWVANRSQFAEVLIDALESHELNEMMGDRAHELALAQYDWPVIARRACDTIRNVLETTSERLRPTETPQTQHESLANLAPTT